MYNVINIVKWREKMKYHESQEMYLETILLLKKEVGIVRSIDIANKLEYSRPSVSRAVNLLQKN